MSRGYSNSTRREIIRLYQAGYSLKYISKHVSKSYYGVYEFICRFKQIGFNVLNVPMQVNVSGAKKRLIVEEFQKESISCVTLALKHNVSRRSIYKWTNEANKYGLAWLNDSRSYLDITQHTMGRPKKKAPETELEILKARLEYLEAENALLKKVKALVEERGSHQRVTGQKPSKN